MNLDEFVQAISARNSQQNHFYHFTDLRNLPSIRRHGLLSMKLLRAQNIRIEAPGGNEWSHDADLRIGMDGYVHLCFRNNHPMEYQARQEGRINDTIFLRITPEIIKLPGAMISNQVSNKKGAIARPAAEMLDELDLEVIYRRTDWNDPAVMERLKNAEKYELLIPDRILVDRITNLDNG